MTTTIDYKFFIPSIIGTLLIFWASSLPDVTLITSGHYDLDRFLSNLAHIPVFAVFTFFWLNSFSGIRDVKINMLVLTGAVLFAGLDEFHQSMVPGRTASFLDLILDMIGICFGYIGFQTFKKVQTG